MSKNTNQLMMIVGNRPQFIKLAPLSKELKKRGHQEFIIHTGQHYDHNLSTVFFDEMDITPPDISLKITGKTHGKMTAEMLDQLEQIFLEHRPKGVLLFGDTNSTLSAALAAVKLKIPLAHVEAGPRIYDIHNPEEVNRIIADKTAQLLFCPDLISKQNLAKEMITEGVFFTGDLMYDAFLLYNQKSQQKSNILKTLKLDLQQYILVTIHRPENTDEPEGLKQLIDLFKRSNDQFVFPIHPRTEAVLKRYHLWEEIKKLSNVQCIAPVGYLDLLTLLTHSRLVITDSGGLQKEAYFAEKPVLLCFHETPWPQIKEIGWQKVVGTLNQLAVDSVINEIQSYSPPKNRQNFFGNGNASAQIVNILESHHWL